jgi:hypothetical protein
MMRGMFGIEFECVRVTLQPRTGMSSLYGWRFIVDRDH